MEEKQHKAATEDKQRIALLVKRVKELEAHAAKSVSEIVNPVKKLLCFVMLVK